MVTNKELDTRNTKDRKLSWFELRGGRCALPFLTGRNTVLVVNYRHANAGDVRDPASIPGSGRSPGEGHSNLFQYSCLENSMDRAA